MILRFIWLLIFALVQCGIAQAQVARGPYSGVGTCPSGQVVNGLVQNGPPQCITGGGGGGGGFSNAGNGLSANGATVSLTTPVTASNGGTGASYTGSGPAAASGIGALARDNNLSDLASASTARTNLGLGAAAVLASPVPIASGGTNATSAAAALTSLGAAALGVNADITQLTGLTTPLSYAQGGTQCKATTFATLPVTPAQGTICTISNASVCTAGTAVTTTGSTPCMVTYLGTSWMPAGGATSSAAGGLTTAGTGLSQSGSTVNLVAPVTVALGGTNATTAGATAANNIGAAALGANSDITSLSGLTTPLSIVQGGTNCKATTFGTLPVAPAQGTTCSISNAAACTAGTAVAGTGSTPCTVSYFGTSWMPAGGATSGAGAGFTTAGTGLSGSGSTVNLSTPVSIANGGTNSTTASGAITNLGGLVAANNLTDVVNTTTARGSLSAAKSGANSDITALSGLTTPLSVAQGGVGCPGAVTVGTLPSPPVAGMQCLVTDAPSCVAGTNIQTGGQSTPCGLVYTGSAWVAGGASSATGGGVGTSSIVGALPYYSAGGTISPVSNTVIYAVPNTSGNPLADAFKKCPTLGWSSGMSVSSGTTQITDSNGNIQVGFTGGTAGSGNHPVWNQSFAQKTNDANGVVWINAGPGAIANSPCTVIAPPGTYNIASALLIGVGGPNATEELKLLPGAAVKVNATGPGQAGIVIGNKGSLIGLNSENGGSVSGQSGKTIDAVVESWVGFSHSALGLTSTNNPNMDVEGISISSGSATINQGVLWVAGVEGQGLYENLFISAVSEGTTAVMVDDTNLEYNAVLFLNVWIGAGQNKNNTGIGYDIECGTQTQNLPGGDSLQIIGGAIVDFGGANTGGQLLPEYLKIHGNNGHNCQSVVMIGTYFETTGCVGGTTQSPQTCAGGTATSNIAHSGGTGIDLQNVTDFEAYSIDLNGGQSFGGGAMVIRSGSNGIHLQGNCRNGCNASDPMITTPVGTTTAGLPGHGGYFDYDYYTSGVVGTN
jgi:hypothetical protein